MMAYVSTATYVFQATLAFVAHDELNERRRRTGTIAQ